MSRPCEVWPASVATTQLLHAKGLACYFPAARRWWLAYEAQATQPGREVERELILRDNGRWLSLGQVVGQKP
jgi:hypothetical protein